MRFMKFYDLPVHVYGQKQWGERGYKPIEGAKAFAFCESEYASYGVYDHTQVMPIKSDRAASARWKFDFDYVMDQIKKMAREYAKAHITLVEAKLGIDCCDATDPEWCNLWGERIVFGPTEENFMQSNWIQWVRMYHQLEREFFFDEPLAKYKLDFGGADVIRPENIPAGHHDKFGWMARGYRPAQPEQSGLHVLDYDGQAFNVYALDDCVEMWGDKGEQRRRIYHGTLRNLERGNG